MKPEQLKEKHTHRMVESHDRTDWDDAIITYDEDDLKSAVEGLIKFHEDRIERLIKTMETYFVKSVEDYIREEDMGLDSVWAIGIYNMITAEYESIMAIEHWLEDVI